MHAQWIETGSGQQPETTKSRILVTSIGCPLLLIAPYSQAPNTGGSLPHCSAKGLRDTTSFNLVSFTPASVFFSTLCLSFFSCTTFPFSFLAWSSVSRRKLKRTQRPPPGQSSIQHIHSIPKALRNRSECTGAQAGLGIHGCCIVGS